MANGRLSMRKIRDVLRLDAEGMSHRKISISLRLGRTTVKNYLLRARLAGLSWPLPDDLSDEGLESLLFPPAPDDEGKDKKQGLPEWKEVHKELSNPNVRLTLLHEEYLEKHSDGYSYSQFCLLYRKWCGKLSKSMRQTHVAGEKTFIDYSGNSIPIIDPDTCEIHKTELFIAVLGASNYTFAEATWTQTMPDWTGSHVRAFEYFGGVTEQLVPDNLKSAVIKACFYEPAINRSYADLARHYDTAILPARSYKPKDKAKAEVAVQIAQRWILGRLRKQTFTSLPELNAAIKELLEQMNDKITRHLGASRRELFEQLDKPALKPLPAEPYVYARWSRHSVGLDYHIKLDDHHYSVPHQLIGRKLWARITGRTVEIFDRGKRIACHMRSDAAKKHTTCNDHMPHGHRKHAELTPVKLMEMAAEIGPDTAILIDVIMRDKPHPEQGFRVGIGIIRLTKQFEKERVEAACSRAIEIGAKTLSSVKSILKNNLDRHKPEEPTDEPAIDHDNIRGSRYFH